MSVHAGIATTASILSGSGDTSGATLQVLRPDNMSDDAVATYLIQAYSDAGATTKVGCERAGLTGVVADVLLGRFAGQPRPPFHCHTKQAFTHMCPPPSPPPQFGEEVRGNNTRAGADGKAQATAFVFPYPYTTAAKLWFKVTVVVGGTRSPASATYGPIIVGECSVLNGLSWPLYDKSTCETCRAGHPLPSTCHGCLAAKSLAPLRQ